MAAVIKVPETPLTVEQMRPIVAAARQKGLRDLRQQREEEELKAEKDRVQRCAKIMQNFNNDYIRTHSYTTQVGMPKAYFHCIPEIRALGYTVSLSVYNGLYVNIEDKK